VTKAEKEAVEKGLPTTPLGVELLQEVTAAAISDDDKAKLTRSIVDYENQKGQVTKTFTRLLRKQLRALG
jgi:hypothetical protein